MILMLLLNAADLHRMVSDESISCEHFTVQVSVSATTPVLITINRAEEFQPDFQYNALLLSGNNKYKSL